MTPRQALAHPALRPLAWAVAATVALAALPGCTNLAPPYQAPALPVPAALGTGSVPVTVTAPAPLGDGSATAVPADPLDRPLEWAEFLQEPRLRALAEMAVANNRDLRVAVLAIERARAQYGVSRADLFPGVNATGAGSRSRTADDLTTAGRSNITGQYSAQLGFASYEIDFFGRVRNLNDAALQEFFRAAENRRSVQLSLVAEAVNAWLTLDADGRRLQLARDTLRTRQQSLDLTQRSHALGATSGLTLAQTQTTVDTARADVATYTAQVARDRNALALLVGATVPDDLLPPVALAAAANAAPATVPPAKATATADGTSRSSAPRNTSTAIVPATPAAALLAVPADLPSGVLLRRPDVRAAERTLQGSYASIGAARAAFFPSITLTGSIGTASNALSGLFDGGNGTWSFAPQIRLPIFDAGRNNANLRVAEVTRDTALAQYEKSIQTAFREVSDALADRATLDERLAAQRSLLDATQRALDLSDARYRLGADSFLTVLDAQRSLYAAQQTQITLLLAEQTNRVTLYKVLGGGWAANGAGVADDPLR
ncbi:efflux transporter outer membrane subunit [Acidovorax sp. SUPP2522]|uniref:efflux transporter outer membrane subunit n=1 Tax=unclassified Acidovorax TaxID=2684926 RepID=UPI002349C645|nr:MULTISPECIES: efflux transporter outer membrane subunit [unclassified Acidovorax]WCM99292.1 efflux transporter outer membrane subunit [Acidovorax sp. GBBC 1281]GKT19809.1 efflux transporter outer membrane subunit [Acidovorax sp. SUPP2522]